MSDHLKPIFVSQRLDEFDLAGWRERLKLVKTYLRMHPIEGDPLKTWAAGEDIKGSTSGGWCRITHRQKHTIGSFTFAHRQSDNSFAPYFTGGPKKIVELYEKAFDNLIIDTTSLDSLEKDEAIDVLEKHFSKLLMDLANAISATSKDQNIHQFLMGKLRLSSGAPFDFPKLETKIDHRWVNLTSAPAMQMLQSMMKPIVSISRSNGSRTLKFGPYTTETRDWVDPGPMAKMDSVKRFFTIRKEDSDDD